VTELLLLHGFTGNPGSWDAVRSALGGRAFLTPALVGHGAPPAAPEVQGFEAEVDRLAELARGPALVAGYSLGARLALGLLVRHPERFKAAVLVSGSPGLSSPEERAERARADQRWIELLETSTLSDFVDHWERQPLFDSQNALSPELRRAERERRLSHTGAGLAQSLRATGTAVMPGYRPLLSRLEQRIEILTGALDQRFCALGRAVVSELPNGALTEVPGAGHNLLLERPRAVADAILRGLEHD
jgi:2-succinyl-6-hydroxy-2,4-cyclohexadiene-1-carboxylate synthase